MINRLNPSENGTGATPEWDGVRWEYQQALVTPDPQQVQMCCLQQGQQGWELCGMLPVAQGSVLVPQQAQQFVMLTFKRMIPCATDEEQPEF